MRQLTTILQHFQIEISIDPNSKLITLQSTNAGIPFDISGAYSTSDELDLTIQNTIENSLGKK